MIACPGCAHPVFARDAACPFCGARVGGPRRGTVAAAILALGLAGCVGGTKGETGETADSGGDTTAAEPPYGVPATGESGDTAGDTGI